MPRSSRKAKLFSGAATDFGAEPNTQVSPVDAGFPGMLPVINGYCVEQAVGPGSGSTPRSIWSSVFDRKNYFYPDLPAGYQISQYSSRSSASGRVVLDMPDGTTREIGITRLHLEQDAGKSLHDQHPTQTYVDLNRAGVALMEIVSEPDLRSAEEAGGSTCASCARSCAISAPATATWRRARCAATPTSRCAGRAEPYGTRCEIKNVNSVRFVMQAIEYEARAPGRADRGRRHGRAGDAAVRCRARRDPADALARRRRTTTAISPTPTCCRWCWSRHWVERIRAQPARAAGREEGALRARVRPAGRGRRRARRRARDRRVFREGGRGPRRRRRRRTGSSAICSAPLNQGRHGHRASRRSSADEPRRADRPDRRRHDLGPASPRTCSRDGRDRAGAARASSRSKGLRQVTDTGAIEPIVDRLIADNPARSRPCARTRRCRLVRRPGDEGDRRQGQPAARQSAGRCQAGPVICAPWPRAAVLWAGLLAGPATRPGSRPDRGDRRPDGQGHRRAGAGGGGRRRGACPRADVPREPGGSPRHAVRLRQPQPVAMWMRNTYVPLDMLFIDSDGRIVQHRPETPSRCRKPMMHRREPVRAVLELRGGVSAEARHRRGDRVDPSVVRARTAESVERARRSG